jgi:putative ABC transport system permease protein
MLDELFQDFRISVRGLLRTPLFAVTVILLTLALGIGTNTAIFSIVDRLLLRPLPYPHAEQLVMMHEIRPNSRRMDVSPANWLDWQRENQL